MPRQRRFALFAALLLLIAGAGYVHWRGGWANIQQLPPVLDQSTPAAQNGYTLASMTRQDAHNYGPVTYLLIRPPAFPHYPLSFRASDGTSEYTEYWNTNGPGLIDQATAQTSSGDTTPLQYTIIGDEAKPQYIRVEIPGGYSNDCHYIDVTLVNNAGPFPRWRITQLPAMHHVLPDSPILTTSMTQSGVTLTARAWRSQGFANLQLRPTLPTNSHQWDMMTVDRRSEWEPFNRPHAPYPENSTLLADHNGKFFNYAAYFAGYRSASRFVQLDCALRQYETYDEAVTFHNITVKPVNNKFDPLSASYGYLSVPQAQSVTTASGIKVTLPVQGLPYAVNNPSPGSLCLTLVVVPSGTGNTLPASPLFVKFHKPTKIEAHFAPPYQSSWRSSDTGPRQNDYTVYSSQFLPNGKRAPLPKILKDFTVIVRQRVDIQTIPMTFTVPVADTPPPDWRR